jgi:hypothetical protein
MPENEKTIFDYIIMDYPRWNHVSKSSDPVGKMDIGLHPPEKSVRPPVIVDVPAT